MTYAEKQEELYKRKMARTVQKRNATRKRNRIALKQQKAEELRLKLKEQGYR